MGPRAPVDPEALPSVLAPPGKNVSLSGEAYTSGDVFAWELAWMWERSWLSLGRSTDLGGSGNQRAAIDSVQRGMASRGHRKGPLSPLEDTVRQFEAMVAAAYLTGSLRAPARAGSLVGPSR